MQGEVEVDETYVGGKPRHKGKNPRGRGTKKAPVVALVQRDGTVRCLPVKNVDSRTLYGEVLTNVDRSATIITDESNLYHGIGEQFKGGHHTVNHGNKEYARWTDGKVIHTNTVESFFALIKRGHYGVYHQMSKRHLHRYCDEFAFRWHYRRTSDAVRTDAAIQAADGKRLMYETSKATELTEI